MAKKNRDLEALERQELVHKQILKILVAAGCAILVLAVFLAVRISRNRAARARAAESEAAAAASSAALAAEQAADEAWTETIREAGFERIELPADPSYTEKVTILGTGDNLIHEALIDDAETDDGYDFSPMYEFVKDDISEADIATVNMESPIAESVAPVSGYPKFNSPDEAGEALIDAGFDIINQGNNHILDMGTEGLLATLDFWDGQGMPYVGAYRNSSDLADRRIIEVNGIKVAFLSFLTETNTDLPEDSSIQLVMFTDEQMIEDLIRDAKEHADVVVVHAHWGVEYTDELTGTMTEMSQKMVDWGADIIFGNHTHILQRLEVLTRSSDGALCPVLYSGGNFLSGQQSRETLLSGLLTVTVAKDPSTGETEVQGISFEPTVTHYEGDRNNVKVYPLADYTEELADSHGVRYEDAPLTLEYLDGLVREHISPQFLTEYLETTGSGEERGDMVSLMGNENSSETSSAGENENSVETSSVDENESGSAASTLADNKNEEGTVS